MSGFWVAFIFYKQNIAALSCCSTSLACSIQCSFGIDSAALSNVYSSLVLGNLFIFEKQIEDAQWPGVAIAT